MTYSCDGNIAERWTGKNRLLCRGRLMMGQAFYPIILSFFLMTIPYVFFLIYPIYVNLIYQKIVLL